MKFSGFENINTGVRSAILISVAAAYFAFDPGFEFGAHGRIFFELLPWIKRREDVTVNCAISQVHINEGMATVNLLYLDSIQMTLVGGGTVNLQDERLDLRFAPRPKKRKFLAHNIDITMKGSLAEPRLASAGAAKWAATAYGKYALIGPLGLLVPTDWSKKHPCVGSLQEFRQQQAEAE